MNQKEVLIISITVFLTVLGWIVADLVHIAHTEQLPDNDPRFSKPISVNIDMKVIEELERRN
jgi:hypothetical protein